MSKFTVNQFKDYFLSTEGIDLDFRKHAYLQNQYGLAPCFNYDLAEKLITNLYAWGQLCIEENPALFPDFGGWQYNLQMSCEKLRTETIRYRIECIVDQLNARSARIARMFDECSIEWDSEAGFLWLEKDGINQFQVCADFNKNGKPIVKKSDCGWNWGVCGDYNFKKHGRTSYEEMEPIFEEFIKRIKQSRIKVV